MKKKFGLIGFPLTHSFSKGYFTAKFEKEGTSAIYTYQNYELPDISMLSGLLISEPLLAGINVTIPHKEKVIPFLDELHGEATEIRAVNTIKIYRDQSGKMKRCVGFNTDASGFYETLKPLLNSRHTGALVLGTGGASKAVLFALSRLNLQAKIISRQKRDGMLTYEEITAELLNKFPVIINTTPVGTFPDITNCPDIPYKLLGPVNLLYDLVYNPPETQFLYLGRIRGAKTINGYSMLVAQAEASWKIWNQEQ